MRVGAGVYGLKLKLEIFATSASISTAFDAEEHTMEIYASAESLYIYILSYSNVVYTITYRLLLVIREALQFG